MATNSTHAHVCHSLTSQNVEVQYFEAQHPTTQKKVIFVEPPGFDHLDKAMDNAEILRIISEWMDHSLVPPSCFVSGLY